MSVRRASSTLQRIRVVPPLQDREPTGPEEPLEALEWQGAVRLDADRASGISAAQRQRQVRAGLLERALVLGAAHRGGSHVERPEVGRRLLAHIDALAEAGASFHEIEAFTAEAELDRPGALWALALLVGCLDDGTPEDAFEAWIASLDGALLLDYRGVDEIAWALRIQPHPALRSKALRWAGGPSATLRAVGLELTTLDELSDDLLLRLSRDADPLVCAALERLFARAPRDVRRPAPAHGSWMDIAVPALCYEAARARALRRDPDPLARLRRRDAAALAALGPHAIDLLALTGDGSDQDLALNLVRTLPGTPHLVEAMGRAGFPWLLPRLLADLTDDELEDDAHAALATMLGPRVPVPSRESWERVAATLPPASRTGRIRGGEPYSVEAVLAEMKRPELSERELRLRADEVLVMTGKQALPDWGAFGVSLERPLSDLARIAR